MTKVLIGGGGTGGHLMPALAIADALTEIDPDTEPVLVGARRGIESKILPGRRYRHYLLPTEPIYRSQWWRNLRWPMLATRVMALARDIVRKEAPHVAVGTGGYAAGPPMLAAARAGIPLAIQEQNAYPGFTTRRLAKRAAQIHLGFPEAKERLRVREGVEVFTFGNPIVPPPHPRPKPEEARQVLGLEPRRPTLFVVGGSQGAAALNAAIVAAIHREAFGDIALIWSTGHAEYERYRSLHAPPDRVVRPFWDPIAGAYAAADLVLARSGAMTTAELCAWGLPAIYVPLAHAAAHHQDANAAALEAAGAAIRISEADLTVDRMMDVIRGLFGNEAELARMGSSSAARGHPKSAEEIARRILKLAR